MANKNASVSARSSARSIVAKWTGLGNGDIGVGPAGNSNLQMPSYPDRTVQVLGTFGTGGSISIEGSNDGTNWVVLSDPLGNALTFTAAGLKQITEMPDMIRPHVTAGDGTTSLSVYLAARGTINP